MLTFPALLCGQILIGTSFALAGQSPAPAPAVPARPGAEIWPLAFFEVPLTALGLLLLHRYPEWSLLRRPGLSSTLPRAVIGWLALCYPALALAAWALARGSRRRGWRWAIWTQLGLGLGALALAVRAAPAAAAPAAVGSAPSAGLCQLGLALILWSWAQGLWRARLVALLARRPSAGTKIDRP